MTTTLLIVLALVADSALVHLGLDRRRLARERGTLLEELRAARMRETALFERLVQARKDGFEILPPEPTPPALPPEPELDPALQGLVDDWEQPEARDAQLNVIRQLRRSGKSDGEIRRMLLPAEEIAE